jgi:hypothetical protein
MAAIRVLRRLAGLVFYLVGGILLLLGLSLVPYGMAWGMSAVIGVFGANIICPIGGLIAFTGYAMRNP